MNEFHFLRPLWLLALLPLAGLLVALWRSRASGDGWRGVIAADLLALFVEPGATRQSRWRWALLGLAWLLAVLGLAGPSWERLPQPVVQRQDALVVVLDLSLSMYATDVQPSRLERAHYKLSDILQRRREGLTGLVAYSGDAHVVTPLTDDAATIANLVSALTPRIMPVYGSDPVSAVELALQLFKNAGIAQGRVLLISDEIRDQDREALAGLLDGHNVELSILGIGTETGAPIPVEGDFIHEPDGGIAIARLHRARLQGLARDVGGRYIDLQVDDSDLDFLLPPVSGGEVSAALDRFDQWRDRAPWLALALLPLAALGARRGLALGLLFALMLPAPRSLALEWRDLWLRPDQQGAQALAADDPEAAASRFQDPDWRASALYRAGKYPQAAQLWKDSDSADAHYNRGNALARSGDLQQALDAYDAALAIAPDDADTLHNRALVEQALAQQQAAQDPSQGESQQNKGKQTDQPGQSGANASSDGDNKADSESATGNSGEQRDNKDKDAGSDPQSAPGDGSQDSEGDAARNAPSPDGSPDRPADGVGDQPGENAAANPPPDPAPEEKGAPDAAAPGQQSSDSSDDQTGEQGDGQAPGPEQDTDLDDQATRQWLQQIPDDPGGLLRNKFDYESRQRGQQRRRLEDQPLW